MFRSSKKKIELEPPAQTEQKSVSATPSSSENVIPASSPEKPLSSEPVKKPEPRETSARTRTTTNLLDALNGKSKEVKTEERISSSVKADVPVQLNELKKVWGAFVEQSKDNMVHYHLLNRDFEFNGTQITLHLTNPIEDPQLDTVKPQLITFLREQLKNSTITVIGVMKEMSARKMAYTNKEKFDQLAEKNPMVKELRDRLGLDVDF